jgi:competence protein ComEA
MEGPDEDAPRGVFGRLRAAIATSAWATLAVRIVAIAAGLVVLAIVGRFTATRPAHAFDAAAPSASMAALAPDPPAAPRVEASAASSAPVAALPTASAAAAPAPISSARATTDDPVFLNYASVEELRRLPGAGQKRAEAILALRQRMGRFQRVEDLLRVKGIGRATLRKWRPLLRLDAPAPRP